MVSSEGFEVGDLLAHKKSSSSEKRPLEKLLPSSTPLPRCTPTRASTPHRRTHPTCVEPSRHAQHEDDAPRARRLFPRPRRRNEKNAIEADPQSRCRRARRRLILGQVRRSLRFERCASVHDRYHDTRAFGPRRSVWSRSSLKRALFPIVMSAKARETWLRYRVLNHPDV